MLKSKPRFILPVYKLLLEREMNWISFPFFLEGHAKPMVLCCVSGVLMASHKGENELLACDRAGHRPSEFLRLLNKKLVESKFKTG